MSNKYDEVMKKQAEQDTDIHNLKLRVNRPAADCTAQEIQQLQSSLNDLEWQSSKHSLEIHGIRMSEKEDLMSKLNNVAKVVDLPQPSPDEVHSLHRFPSGAERWPGVIIRFTRHALRDKCCEKRKVLRAKHSLTENMTRQNRNLLRYTREWAADNGYRFAWRTNNKILLRMQ